MKKTITIATFMLTLGTGLFAQMRPPESIVPDGTFTDIKGNTFSLYGYLNQGYSVFVEFMATWCPYCWEFHQMNTMQDIYNKYGPNGTVAPRTIMPIMIESDTNTALAALSVAERNWVEGKSYHIVNIDTWEQMLPFFEPGQKIAGYPSYMMICPDRTVLAGSAGQNSLGAISAELLYNMHKRCGNATALPELGMKNSLDLLIYPNPVQDRLYLQSSIVNEISGRVRIMDLSGKVIYSLQLDSSLKFQDVIIEVEDWPSGIYIVNLEIGSGENLFRRFTKQ